MAKLIFTADDYGIVEAIDNGVCEAISEGWINSVEVFPNDPNKVQRSVQKLGQLDLGKFAQAQGIQESDAVINVGAHLTITSGYPLTKSRFFRQQKGSYSGAFRKWVEFERPKLKDRVQEILDLEIELRRQIETLKAEADKYPTLSFNHLTCHHNSLYYFEDYTATFYKIAKEYDMAVRTPIGRPKIKDNLFYLQLNIRLADDLDDGDLDHMWDFHKNMDEFLARQKTLPKMTAFHNNVHYGPPPFINLDARGMVRKARSKFKKMNKWLKKHEQDESVEFVFHLIEWDPGRLEEFEAQASFSQSRYPGINPGYFDGRMAEYYSLLNLMKNDPSIATQFVNWSNL